MVSCCLGMIFCFLIIQVMVSLETDNIQLVLIVTVLAVNTVYSSINAIFQV